jgi:ribosomal protein S18 acetylase RimI-like enzyme
LSRQRKVVIMDSSSPSRHLPLPRAPEVLLFDPVEAHEIDAARTIFRDYADALGIDLQFQNFDAELAGLPGEYAAPRGALLLALVDAAFIAGGGGAGNKAAAAPTLEHADGKIAHVAGCCALRPLDTTDYANAAEMKRLYVRPGFRSLGLGRQLAEAMLDAARNAGYTCVLLDTLDDMEAARALYEDLGFVEVPPYYHNPIAGSHYLRAVL